MPRGSNCRRPSWRTAPPVAPTLARLMPPARSPEERQNPRAKPRSRRSALSEPPTAVWASCRRLRDLAVDPTGLLRRSHVQFLLQRSLADLVPAQRTAALTETRVALHQPLVRIFP